MIPLTCASPAPAPPSSPASQISPRPPAPRVTSSPPCSARPVRTAAPPRGPHQAARAQGKTLVASARKPISEVLADAFAEADRRDPGHARPWFAVVDGNNAQIAAINALAAERQVKIPVLIDFIHVVQYLWKAAGSFFYPGDPAARAWVKNRPPDPGREPPRRPRRDPPPRHRLGLQPARTRGSRRPRGLPGEQAGRPGYAAFAQSRVAVARRPDRGRRHAGSSRTACRPQAQDGASTAPRPSSGSVPSPARRLRRRLHFPPANKRNDATTTAATSKPRPAPHNQPRPYRPTFKRAAPLYLQGTSFKTPVE